MELMKGNVDLHPLLSIILTGRLIKLCHLLDRSEICSVHFTEITLRNMSTSYSTYSDSVHFILLPLSFIALYDELGLDKI